MQWISDPDVWLAFLTLCGLEVVLGIDNIIFISIVTDRLPENRRDSARRIGLVLAMCLRILLLFTLTWIMAMTDDLFTVLDNEISGRDLILMAGGLFLIVNSLSELRGKSGGKPKSKGKKAIARYGATILQIGITDIVFSFDSVITALGMVEYIEVMVAAVVFSVSIMMLASGPISRFINSYPTLKVLALAFLIMIGASLVAEGWGLHIPKGYLYFAMAFSGLVEWTQIRLKTRKN